jgi:hypothetical protein
VARHAAYRVVWAGLRALRPWPARSNRERVNRNGMFQSRRTPVSGSNR